MARFTTIRGLLLALALAFTARVAGAQSEPTAARAKGDTVPTAPDGFSLDGLVIIVGIVAVVILLAWVCSRVSDSR